MSTATAALAATSAPVVAASTANAPPGPATANGATPSTPATAPVSTAGTWYDGVNPENLAVLDAKGWKKLPTQADALNVVLGSYRSMESTFTADKQGRTVVVPKEGAEAAEVEAFHVKLGRPEKIDGYKIPDALKNDPAVTAWKDLAFKTGITGTQFDETMKLVQGQAAAVAEAQTAAHNAAVEKAVGTLKGEWAVGYERNMQAARLATKQLGWDEPTIEAMSRAHPGGAEKFFRELSKAGQGLLEAKNVDGSAIPAAQTYTPAEAKTRMDALSRDKTFTARLTAGNVEAKKEWSDLVAYRAGKTPEEMAAQLAAGGGLLKS